ncbi:MAG: hypothetical protein VB857_08880 [Pirellulaceae bacterium]
MGLVIVLREIELPRIHGPLPERVATFLEEARVQSDRFHYEHRDQPISGFVASDYRQVFFAIEHLKQTGLLRGRCFCEWGSGLGVVAGLAAIHGFLAYGIEVEPLLVSESANLLQRHRLDVAIACGSFIADDIAHPELNHQEMSWVDLEASSGYHLIDLEPGDVDLFFVYPWPGENLFVQQLFEDSATPGAMLLAYLGADELACWQKTSS